MRGDFPVVALVCSAGGLDALVRVLAPLPAGLPAAVVALQHLDPERASQLPALLQRRTALAVAPAADGAALRPGRLLVAPSGQHTLVTGGLAIALIRSGAVPPYRPSADLLLTTLAVAAGARVIAVVLSGGGNDAATGAEAVHHFGGRVIVSSEATSTNPAMPRAAIGRGSVVDHVLPLDDVAGLLVALIAAAPPHRRGAASA
jgi:two-component system chemotaxis response regulator CheB